MDFSPPHRQRTARAPPAAAAAAAEVLLFSPGVVQQPRSRHAVAAAAEPDFDSVFDDSVDSVEMSFDAEAAGDWDDVATAAPIDSSGQP